MKKISTVAMERIEIFKQNQLTIGFLCGMWRVWKHWGANESKWHASGDL